MEKFIYVGPSWAARSYDTALGTEKTFTNLQQQWGIPCIDLSRRGQSNKESLQRILDQNVDLPVIFIIADPLMDIELNRPQYFNNISNKQLIEDFLTSKKCHDVRLEILEHTLDKFNDLGLRIGIIGAHTDIHDIKKKNITVLNNSWQSFLGNMATKKTRYGWGAEISHKFIVNQQFSDLAISDMVVNETYETIKWWNSMEFHRLRLFTGCHPSWNGNVEYAKYMIPIIEDFLK